MNEKLPGVRGMPVAPWFECEDGYPTEASIERLEAIANQNFDSDGFEWWANFLVHDLPFIREQLFGAGSGCTVKMVEEWGTPMIEISLSTFGWSGVEEVIDIVWHNKFVQLAFAYSWQRGGHFVFRVNPKYMSLDDAGKDQPTETPSAT